MNRKRSRRSRRALGMTGRQITLLVILAALILLVISVTLAFALGVFDRSTAPTLPIGPSSTTAGEALDTQTPGTPLDQASPPAAGTPSPAGSETPALTPTVTTSTPATPTAAASPTSTPPAEICAQIDLRFHTAISSIAAWRLQNHSGTMLTIARIEIDWPKTNDAIFNAILNGETIWAGEDLQPPTTMSDWIGDLEDRSVDRLARLEFFFGTLAASSGYDLHLWFENGCEVSAAN